MLIVDASHINSTVVDLVAYIVGHPYAIRFFRERFLNRTGIHTLKLHRIMKNV